jgi:alpha 1,6-mannosyltransferase
VTDLFAVNGNMFTPFRRFIPFAVFAVILFLVLRSSHQDRSWKTAHDMPKPDQVQHWEDTKHSGGSQQPSKPPPHRKISSNRKPKTQIPMQDLLGKPLRKQLEIQFPYDATSKFPAYIWQTWKVTPGDGKFPEDYRGSEASWTELHPGFVHEVISDDVAPHLMKHLYASIPEVLEAYESLPMAVMKADFFRYLILLARGGIYTDIDTTALKGATEWVPVSVPRSTYGMVIGIEADPDRPDWAQWYSRRIQFCQWTIQAKPGHPVLRDIVANITEETLRRKKAGKLRPEQKGIVEFTGPARWTDTIFHYFNNPSYFDLSTGKGNITWEHFTGIKTAKKVGDVVILPITSFSPGIETMGAGADDDPMAYVKHYFEGL